MANFDRPYRALVVGASGGIGGRFATMLAEAGTPVHALARRPIPDCLNITGGHIDVTDEASIVAALSHLTPEIPLRLALVATGLVHDGGFQPEKSLRNLDAASLARSFAVNTIGPALVAKHVLPLLPRQGRSVFAVLSARVGSIADNRLGGWYVYRASKAALNQMVRTLAVEVRRTKPDAVVVALHPGTVETALSEPFRGNVEPERLFTADDAAKHLRSVIDGLTSADSGGFFAWDGTPIPF